MAQPTVVVPLIASIFRSDGGSMFGLVPRPIWSTRITPDEKNRIAQHAHALLIKSSDGSIGLIDTGCGDAAGFTAKEADRHGLGPGWPLLDALTLCGVKPDDLDFVAFTHLHWDHAGGAIHGDKLTFPNARHIMMEVEWHAATSRDPLLYKSYPPHIAEALGHAKLELIESTNEEIAPGVRMISARGHTAGQAAFIFEPCRLEKPDGSPLGTWPIGLFAGDNCPTRHHLRMVFQTSYDTYPLDTRAWKKKWLPRIAEQKGILLFDHDPDAFGATIHADAAEEFATGDLVRA